MTTVVYPFFARRFFAVLISLAATFPPMAFAGDVEPPDAAQDGNTLVLRGSFRLRDETLAGQARPGISATDDLISMRTTLFAEYQFAPFRIGAELYDSRAYGDKQDGSVSASDVNAFELAQAYVAFDQKAPFGPDSTSSIEAGRFILNLGSRRLVAADDYRNAATTMTGLRANFLTGSLAGTFVYVLPNMHRPDDKASVLKNTIAFDRESFDLVLWGGVLTKSRAIGDAAVDLTYFHLQEHDAPRHPTLDRALNTLGPRLILAPSPGHFDGEVETFYQFGTISDGIQPGAAQFDVSAGFFHFDMGYTFAHPWQPRLSFEYDLAAGDDFGSTYTRFDTLFGMRRAELAPFGIYGVVGRTNVSTPGLRLEVAPSSRFDWFVNYRVLWLASPTDSFSTGGVRDPSGGSGGFAGQQIEGRIRYWIVPSVLLFETDAALLLKGHFLNNAPNAPATGNTRYFSFNLTTYF